MDRSTNHRHLRPIRGFTLVELMITIAVLTILTSIAIPLYSGYIREGHYAALHANLNSLRTPIEDFRLENGNYGAAGNLTGEAAINARFGWDPGSDISRYDYTVAIVGTNNYHVWGTFGADIWVRCEDRMSKCCESDGGGSPSSACP
ncbi:MAG: prepilin-type N-terminal cleavage/methylation domain-containing protein [Sedimenticolaceae bacterium]